LPDVLASLRYDDEQMAAAFLAMFTKVGTTETGSRVRGGSLIDFFALAQEAVAKQYADVTNEHVIEDLVDVNYGIDEAAPLLKFETDKRYSVADMKALIDAGALTTDPELEAYIRAEGDLPRKPEADEEDQGDEGDDKITPIGPAARKQIKAKRTEPQAAMTVGSRTARMQLLGRMERSP
jgi:hypothetical protein